MSAFISGSSSIWFLYSVTLVTSSLEITEELEKLYLEYEDNLFTKYYTLLDEEFTLDRGIILPTGWTTSLSTKDTNILKIEDNKITPIKTGMGKALQAVYNSEKTLAQMTDEERLNRQDGHTSAIKEFVNFIKEQEKVKKQTVFCVKNS